MLVLAGQVCSILGPVRVRMRVICGCFCQTQEIQQEADQVRVQKIQRIHCAALLAQNHEEQAHTRQALRGQYLL